MTLSASSDVGFAIWSCDSEALRSTPFGCSERTSTLARIGHAGQPASGASGTPVQVCVVVQPSTQAIGSDARALRQREQVVARERDLVARR